MLEFKVLLPCVVCARDDLLAIKNIRNAFAHTRKRLCFKAPEIKELSEGFRGHPTEADAREFSRSKRFTSPTLPPGFLPLMTSTGAFTS